VAPSTGGSDAAPPFESIANNPLVTEEGLRAWLADPHPPMPKFDLTRTEIDDIIAYIKSLKRE
jgi:mono/diheme cytochrome c family protein